MKPTTPSPRLRSARLVACSVLLLLVALPALRSSAARRGPDAEAPAEKEKAAKKPAVLEAQLIDDSTLRMTLRDERIELETAYGKLQIPVRDIQRIELASRVPEDVTRRVEAAIADLGGSEFRRREAAAEELRDLGERAYPALVKAEKSGDAEVARRAREILEHIRSEVPEENLAPRPHDVVYTAGSKNTGRISSASIKVHTLAFGEQQLQLANVRVLRSPSAAEPDPAEALPDPGSLNTLMGQVGKVFAFRVTGGAPAGGMAAGPGGIILGGGAQGAVWGTDTYTLDSTLALAAVHAGVVKPGQTKVVRVKILGPQAAFQGSTRHGVASMAFGPYGGSFQFVRGRGR